MASKTEKCVAYLMVRDLVIGNLISKLKGGLDYIPITKILSSFKPLEEQFRLLLVFHLLGGNVEPCAEFFLTELA